MRVAVVFNPHSGKQDTRNKLAAIHAACREAGTGYQVLTAGGDGTLDAIRKRLLEVRPDRVLVCGGDGTVTAVGNALLHSEIALGILPGGTANAIARAIGVPGRIGEAVTFALREQPRPFDALRINDRTSLLISGAGYDSDVIASADPELKRRIGLLAYVWSGLLQLGALNETNFEVVVDDLPPQRVKGNCLLIANIGKLFGEFDLFRDTRPDDGEVHVAVLTLGDLAEFLSLSGRALAGIDNPSHQSAFFSGKEVKVTFSRSLRTQIDGDVGGITEQMNAKVLPGALSVVRSAEGKKPLLQMPQWVASVADNLMGQRESYQRNQPPRVPERPSRW